MKDEQYIRENLFPKLEKIGIKVSPDYVKRHDGALCDNILFTKGDVEKRIYRPLLFRQGGQRFYMAAMTVKGKVTFDLKPLTNPMWVDNFFHNLKYFFEK